MKSQRRVQKATASENTGQIKRGRLDLVTIHQGDPARLIGWIGRLAEGACSPTRFCTQPRAASLRVPVRTVWRRGCRKQANRCIPQNGQRSSESAKTGRSRWGFGAAACKRGVLVIVIGRARILAWGRARTPASFELSYSRRWIRDKTRFWQKHRTRTLEALHVQSASKVCSSSVSALSILRVIGSSL